MPVHGGNSIINGGDFCAPDTKLQKAAGVKDSPVLMYADMMKAGQYLNHPELARIVANQSRDALEWSESYVGAQFTRLNYHGGHSVKRANQTINASGSELVNKMFAKIKELGVNVQTRTKLVSFITNKDGRIVGIEVLKGYRFPDEKSGKVAYIKAARAVVLTSGGFLETLYAPGRKIPASLINSINQPTRRNGEALLIARRLVPWCSDGLIQRPGQVLTKRASVMFPCFVRDLSVMGLIDPKQANDSSKKLGIARSAQMLLSSLDIRSLFSAIPMLYPNRYFQMHSKGIEAGAIKIVPLKTWLKTMIYPLMLSARNGALELFVEKKKDDDFDCMIFPDAKPTVTGPFYAARLWPKVHHTMGGLVIDKNAQVIGFDFKPVKGLYAAGEVTGGVHGAVRLGGVAMADCIVFGRIAGQNAAKEKAWG